MLMKKIVHTYLTRKCLVCTYAKLCIIKGHSPISKV